MTPVRLTPVWPPGTLLETKWNSPPATWAAPDQPPVVADRDTSTGTAAVGWIDAGNPRARRSAGVRLVRQR